MSKLILKTDALEIEFESFNRDKELPVTIWETGYGYHLSPHQTNELINFLAYQLKSIGEPIDLLNKIIE
jgi:hypothetical protein